MANRELPNVLHKFQILTPQPATVSTFTISINKSVKHVGKKNEQTKVEQAQTSQLQARQCFVNSAVGCNPLSPST